MFSARATFGISHETSRRRLIDWGLLLVGFPLVWMALVFLLREAVSAVWLLMGSTYIVLAFVLAMKGVTGNQPPVMYWQRLRWFCSWLFRIWMGSFLLLFYIFLFMMTFYPGELFAR